MSMSASSMAAHILDSLGDLAEEASLVSESGLLIEAHESFSLTMPFFFIHSAESHLFPESFLVIEASKDGLISGPSLESTESLSLSKRDLASVIRVLRHTDD